jgi:acetolactate synthase-1/3 small subunit
MNNGNIPPISLRDETAHEGKTLYTLIIFSENLAGVLNQVTNAFTRRQLNIESLNVSPSGFQHIHRYTITCYSDERTICTLAKQIEKKIDVIQVRYFTADDIYVMEQALYKIATAKLLDNKEISKAIRFHDSKIVEVNATYSIVSKEGLPEDIMELYRKLHDYGCLLQFVSSGVIAVTKSRREELSEFLELRDEEYRQQHRLPL